MFESFSLSPFALGNPDLKPERARSAELGVEQRVAHDRAKFELTYFHNSFRDIISLLVTDPTTYEGQFFNVGLTRAQGLEAGVEVAPTPAIRMHGSYTLLDSKIVESSQPTHPLFGLGRQAFRRPRHSGLAGVTLAWKRLSADLNGVFIGTFVDSDFGLFDPPLVENPGHTTWNMRLAVPLAPRISGTLAIDNLTDRDYSEPFGYQPLGRAIRAGLRVTY
jgi:vitamin B12 transporter